MKIPFLILFAFASISNAAECGKAGLLADRIRDCNVTAEDVNGEKWSLVNRVDYEGEARTHSIWLQQKTNRLWTDGFYASQTNAFRYHCVEKSPWTGQLSGSWRVPSASDYLAIRDSKSLGKILQYRGPSWFWTDRRNYLVRIESGQTAETGPGNVLNVMCIQDL